MPRFLCFRRLSYMSKRLGLRVLPARYRRPWFTAVGSARLPRCLVSLDREEMLQHASKCMSVASNSS